MKLEAAGLPETLITFYHTAHCHISQNSNLSVTAVKNRKLTFLTTIYRESK
jgi:hypothetical protein